MFLSLKCFHPPFDTAGTHAGIFIHITKSLIIRLLTSFPLSQEIQWQHVNETTCQWPQFSRRAWRQRKRRAWADFAVSWRGKILLMIL